MHAKVELPHLILSLDIKRSAPSITMVHVATNSSKESKREGIRDVLKSAPNAFPPKQTGLSTSTCVWGALGVASLGGVGSISSTKFTIAAVVGAFSDKCATSITALLASRETREEAIDMKTGTAMKTGTGRGADLTDENVPKLTKKPDPKMVQKWF